MNRAFLALTSDTPGGPVALPGLRPGVLLIGEGDDAELRDAQLGQVVKLGGVAAAIVACLDGVRDAEALLRDVGKNLGMDLDPMGLLELLQALDRRALLDTPRARMIADQGMMRADVAALQRLARRSKAIDGYMGEASDEKIDEARVAPASNFNCHSCTKCCSEKNLLGPVSRAERDLILEGFRNQNNLSSASPANFIPLSGQADGAAMFLLRAHDGHCVFLQSDGLCRIHKELGEELKPSACRLFPFRGVRTPTGWDMGMSLSCPTVAMGHGGDPSQEAKTTLAAVIEHPHLLRQVPDRVALTGWRTANYEVYDTWEREYLRRIAETSRDAAESWLKCVEGFYEILAGADVGGLAPWEDETQLDVECETVELSESTKDDESEQFVPLMGVGTTDNDVGKAADTLLRDVALWSELLVGLEASDPQSLQRFRKGLHHLRQEVGCHDDDPPVLAEIARVEAAQASRATATDTLSDEDAEDFHMSTRPSLHRVSVVSGRDADVQRRFLTQALFEKRLFEYSSIRRGLVSVTMMLGVMRLEAEPWDDAHPRVSDLAYLLHHPQLTDIIDSRASVRQDRAGVELHRTILGLNAT